MWLRYMAVVPLSVACFWAWSAWRHARMRRKILRWPVAEGRVVQSGVEVRQTMRNTTYALKLAYEFRVGKQSVRSTSQSPEGVLFTSSLRRAENLVARFRVGKKLRVRYDKDDPRCCFLEGHSSAMGIWISVTGAFAFAGGAALIWTLV
jgi:hypothetical protein